MPCSSSECLCDHLYDLISNPLKPLELLPLALLIISRNPYVPVVVNWVLPLCVVVLDRKMRQGSSAQHAGHYSKDQRQIHRVCTRPSFLDHFEASY